MPGLHKREIARRMRDMLEESACSADAAEFRGARGGLPWYVHVTFPTGAMRRYNVYCWTLGHGGRTRKLNEYRIQAKLNNERALAFQGATTVLLGYYDPAADHVGRDLGIMAPQDMRVVAAWNPIFHSRVGASSSCQVGFDTLYHAHLAGTADCERRIAGGQSETVLAFRTEYLARYLYLVTNGHSEVTKAALSAITL